MKEKKNILKSNYNREKSFDNADFAVKYDFNNFYKSENQIKKLDLENDYNLRDKSHDYVRKHKKVNFSEEKNEPASSENSSNMAPDQVKALLKNSTDTRNDSKIPELKNIKNMFLLQNKQENLTSTQLKSHNYFKTQTDKENKANTNLIKIDQKYIINRNYFDSLENVLKCIICDYILNNPYDCEKCGNTFCFDCIANIECPFKCRIKAIKPSSQNIKSLLANLVFSCTNKNCMEKIYYNDYLSHLTAECQFGDFHRVELKKIENLLSRNSSNLITNKTNNNNVADNFNAPKKIETNNINSNNSNNININIPVIIRNSQKDFLNLQSNKRRIKNEIENDMDHFFKNLLDSKKKKKKKNPNETISSNNSKRILYESELIRIMKNDYFTILSSYPKKKAFTSDDYNYIGNDPRDLNLGKITGGIKDLVSRNFFEKESLFVSNVNLISICSKSKDQGKINENNNHEKEITRLLNIYKVKNNSDGSLQIIRTSFSIEADKKINNLQTIKIDKQPFVDNKDYKQFSNSKMVFIENNEQRKENNKNNKNYNNENNSNKGLSNYITLEKTKRSLTYEDPLSNFNRTVVVKKSNLLENNQEKEIDKEKNREIIRQRVMQMRKKAKNEEENSKQQNLSLGGDSIKLNTSLIKNNSTTRSEFGEAIKEKVFEENTQKKENEDSFSNEENKNVVEIQEKNLIVTEQKEFKEFKTPEFNKILSPKALGKNKNAVNDYSGFVKLNENNEEPVQMENLNAKVLDSPKNKKQIKFINSNINYNSNSIEKISEIDYSFKANVEKSPNFNLNAKNQNYLNNKNDIINHNNFGVKVDEKYYHTFSDDFKDNKNEIKGDLENILSKISLLDTKLDNKVLIKEEDKELILKDLTSFLKKEGKSNNKNIQIENDSEINNVDKQAIKYTLDENTLSKLTQENKKNLNNFYDKLILLIENQFANLIFQKLNSLEQKLNISTTNKMNYANNNSSSNIRGLDITEFNNNNYNNENENFNISQVIERNYQDIIDYMKINFKEIKQIYGEISNCATITSKVNQRENYNSSTSTASNFNLSNESARKLESEPAMRKIISESLENFKKDFQDFFEKSNKANSANNKNELEKQFKNFSEKFENNYLTINNHNQSEKLLNKKIHFNEIPNETLIYNNNRNSLSDEKLSQIKEITESMNSNLNNNFLQTIQTLFNKTETTYENKLRSLIGEIYNHKWCYSCEKINFQYSFLKCLICKMDYCISCTFKCLKCDNIYCKYCVECSMCGDFFCSECRSNCNNKGCENKLSYLSLLALKDSAAVLEQEELNKNNESANTSNFNSERESLASIKLLKKTSNTNFPKERITSITKIKTMLCKIRSTTENQLSDIYQRQIATKSTYTKVNKIPENNFLESCKQFKICESCTNLCKKCKKTFCKKSCLAKCHVCLADFCPSCSKTCHLCGNSCCQICTEKYKFAFCHCCKKSTCASCLENCEICQLEPCAECAFKCEYCRRKGCRDNQVTCGACAKSFCDRCAAESKFSTCFLCKEVICDACADAHVCKCTQCTMPVCLKCCSACRKCKDPYCKSCKTRCMNCHDVVCAKCVFQCVCEKVSFCQICLFDIKPICSHECVQFLNGTSVFSGRKTRSVLPMPESFEAKLFLESLDSKNILIGLTDNCNWEDDSLNYVDDIWGFKPLTGEKYSSKKGVESYLKVKAKEKDFVLVTKIKQELFFRVNYELTPVAFKLDNVDKDLTQFYLYLENDKMLSKAKVLFIYIRKI